MAKNRKLIDNLANIQLTEEDNKILSHVDNTKEEIGGGYIEGRGYLDERSGQQGLYTRNTDIKDHQATVQSDAEAWGRSGKKALYGAAAGLLDGFNYDIPEMGEMLVGKEKKYGSWLHSLAQSVQDKASSKELEIYAKDTSYGNDKTWANMMANSGYTLGLVTQSIAEQVLLTKLTAGTLGGAAPIQIAAATSKLHKLKRLWDSGKALRLATFGAFTGMKEAHLNAMDTQQTVMKSLMDSGMSEEDAIKASAKAATDAYKTEVGFTMALNALQLSSVRRASAFNQAGDQAGRGVSDFMEMVSSPLTKNIKNKPLKKTAEYLVSGISEGVEEVVQTSISSYHTEKADEDAGLGLSDFTLYSRENLDSAIMGFTMGMIFKGGGDSINAISGVATESGRERNKEKKIYRDYIKKAGERHKKVIEQHKKDVAEGKATGTVGEAMNISHGESLRASLEKDMEFQTEGAFDSYVGTLEEIHEAAKNGDLKALKEQGIETEAEINSILENYPKMIEGALQYKADTEAAWQNTKHNKAAIIVADAKYKIKMSDDGIQTLEQEINDIVDSNDSPFSSLSTEGQDFVKAHFQDFVDKNTDKEKKKASKEAYNSLPKKDKELFKGILNSGGKIVEDLSIKMFIKNNLQDKRKGFQETIDTYNDPVKVIGKIKEHLLEDIDSAKDLGDIDNIEKAFSQYDLLDDEVKAKINSRKSKIKEDKKVREDKEKNLLEEEKKREEAERKKIEEVEKLRAEEAKEKKLKTKESVARIKTKKKKANKSKTKNRIRKPKEEDFKALKSKDGKVATINGKRGRLKVRDGSVEVHSLDSNKVDVFPNDTVNEIKYEKDYEIVFSDEKSVTVNGIEYKVNTDDKGNIVSLDEGNKTIKNQRLIIAIEIERNKTEFKNIEESVAEEIIEDLDPDVNKLLDSIYNINFTSTIDKALDKLYNEEKLTSNEKLQLDLWLRDSFARLARIHEEFSGKEDMEIISNAYDNLETIAQLLTGVPVKKRTKSEKNEKLEETKSNDTTKEDESSTKENKNENKEGKVTGELVEDTGTNLFDILSDSPNNPVEEASKEASKEVDTKPAEDSGSVLFPETKLTGKDAFFLEFNLENIVNLLLEDDPKLSVVEIISILEEDFQEYSIGTEDLRMIHSKVGEGKFNLLELKRSYEKHKKSKTTVKHEPATEEQIVKEGSEAKTTKVDSQGIEKEVVLDDHEEVLNLNELDTQDTIHKGSGRSATTSLIKNPDTQDNSLLLTEDFKEVEISVHPEHDSIVIEFDGVRKPFGQFGFIEGSTNWKTHVPLAVVVTKNNQKVIVQTVRGGEKSKVREILNSASDTVTAEVTAVYGERFEIKTEDGTLKKTVAEDHEDSMIGVIPVDGSSSVEIAGSEDNKIIPGTSNYKKGQVVQIIKNGRGDYEATLLETPELSEEQKETVMELISLLALKFSYDSHLGDKSKYPGKEELDKKLKNFSESIGKKEASKEDILDAIKGYLYLHESEKNFNSVDINLSTGKISLKFFPDTSNVIHLSSLVDDVNHYYNVRAALDKQHLNVNIDVSNNPQVELDKEGNFISNSDNKTYLKNNLRVRYPTFTYVDGNTKIHTKEPAPKLQVKLKTLNSGGKSVSLTHTQGKKSDTKKSNTTPESVINNADQVIDEVFGNVPTDINEITEKFRSELVVEALIALKDLGFSDIDPEVKALREILSDKDKTNDSVNYSKEFNESGDSGITLTAKEEISLVDFVFNKLLSEIDFKNEGKLSKDEILKSIKNSYDEGIKTRRKSTEELITKMRESFKGEESVENVLDSLEKRLEVYDVIENSWPDIQKKALKKLESFGGVKTSKDVIESVSDKGTEKNFSQESFEQDPKAKVGALIKKVFGGIERKDPNGETVTGFLGLPVYEEFDVIDNTLRAIFSVPSEVSSDFDTMLERMTNSSEGIYWMKDLIEELRNGDKQLQNQFVYNYVSHSLDMRFMMYDIDKSGNVNYKIYKTNSRDVLLSLQREWENNFTSRLVIKKDSLSPAVLSREHLKALHTRFWELDKKVTKDGIPKENIDVFVEEVQVLLSSVGVTMSEDALKSLLSNDYVYDSNISKNVAARDLFKIGDSPANSGIIGRIGANLKKISESDKATILADDHKFFEDISTTVKFLSGQEAIFRAHYASNSFRDGKKTIYGYTNPKFATDSVDRLKNEEDYRESFNGKSFSEDSLWLELMGESMKNRNMFSVQHLGINSLREMNKRLFKEMDITGLTDLDSLVTRLGFFQDTKTRKIRGTKDGFSLRAMTHFFPTMSDKSQMLLMESVGYDFRDVDNFKEGLSDDMKEVLYKRVVLPELKRIARAATKGHIDNTAKNSASYKLFNVFPQINNKEFLNYALSSNSPSVDQIIAEFENNYKEAAMNTISGVITNEINHTLNQIEDIKDSSGKLFLDKKYLDSIKKNDNTTENEIERAAIGDYVVNSIIANMNMHQLIIGDYAQYGSDKLLNNFYDKDITKPKSETSYYDSVTKGGKSLLSNLNKRLAAIAAPGKKIAAKKDEKYIQVFLKDMDTSIKNAEMLARLHYPTKEKEIMDLAEKVKAGDNKALKEINNNYPNIAPFFNLEATDAQEYTTVKEHTDILYRQGRMSESIYNAISDKLKKREALKDQKTIPEELQLNLKELKVVMQPIKPVYAGLVDDVDSKRMVYIKTSSFPLLHELTAGSELDNLRVSLEKLQKSKKMNVRASYLSGNKVGALSSGVAPFDSSGRFDGGFDLKVGAASMILNRRDFKIQQDVPFKSYLKDEDKVSLATQMLKVLLGNGITDIKSKAFNYNGVKLTGKQLKEEFDSNFVSYIEAKASDIRKSLGLDEDNQPISKVDTLLKIQEFLKEEAESREYSPQSIESLDIVISGDIKIGDEVFGNLRLSSHDLKNIKKLSNGLKGKDALDKVRKALTASLGKDLANSLIASVPDKKIPTSIDIKTTDFKLPLWINPDANKFESLVNAVITNKLIQFKLPGASYVAGSEAGFVYDKSHLSQLTEEQASKIIYTSKFNGSLAPASIVDGELVSTQVFLPSKFRNSDGSLIDLFEDYDKESSEGKYVTFKEGRFQLKDGMIEEDLMKIVSMRIPTSAHVSGVQVEIAGFLPEEVGDLMIVPANLTVQKGLDFDIDKETTYSTNHILTDSGEIKSLNSVYDISEVNAEIASLESSLENYTEQDIKDELDKIKDTRERSWKIQTTKYNNLVNKKRSREDIIDTLIEVRDELKEERDFLASLEVESIEIDSLLSSLYDNLTENKEKEMATSLEKILFLSNKESELLTKLEEDSKISQEEIRDRLNKRKQAADKYNKSVETVKEKFTERLGSVRSLVQLRKLRNKIYENNIVEGHKAVFGSPSLEVQKKINKVLSMEDAGNQANLVESISKDDKSSRFSTASPSVQMDLMFLGSSGKLGIGVYSNSVTFLHLVHQLEKPLKFKDRGFKIGNIKSEGEIGPLKALRSSDKSIPNKVIEHFQRDLSTVFEERQNTATDNVKEGIMGRLNINAYTINLDDFMSMLGFDKDIFEIKEKDYDESSTSDYKHGDKYYRAVSIPYFISSSPIIKEIVKTLQKDGSYVSDFNYSDMNSVIKDKLILNKSNMSGAALKMADVDKNYYRDFVTGENLHSYHRGELSPEDVLRIESGIMEIFSDFDSLSKNLNKFKGLLAINKDGLGITRLQSSAKFSNMLTLEKDFSKMFTGSFKDLMYKEGNNIFVGEATTPAGAMIKESLSLSTSLWSPYFLQEKDITSHIFHSIHALTSKVPYKELSDRKKVEQNTEIFKDLRKFLVSSKKLYGADSNPYILRQELFFSRENKDSLASYLNNIFSDPENPYRDFLQENALLRLFSFDIKSDNQPDSIIFGGTQGKRYDENYIYAAMSELLNSKRALPKFNGKEYSTDTLVKDLINYSLLEGGVQEAKQFIKYVPLNILESLGYAEIMRGWSSTDPKFLEALDVMSPRFIEQYIQHHPEKVVVKNTKNITNKTTHKGEIIQFKLNSSTADYVSLRNTKVPKGMKRYTLYKRTDSGFYTKIAVLGHKDMVEYSPQISDASSASVINSNPTRSPGKVSKSLKSTSNNLKVVVEALNNTPDISEETKKLVNQLSSMLKSPVSVITNTDLVGKFGPRAKNAVAAYSKGNIYFATNNKTNEEKAKILVHEMLHALTKSYLGTYYKNGVLSPAAPDSVKDFIKVYENVKSQLSGDTSLKTQYSLSNPDEFLAHYFLDADFKKKLKDMEYTGETLSVFTKIRDSIKNLIEFFNANSNSEGIDSNLIRNVMEVSTNLVHEASKNTNTGEVKVTDVGKGQSVSIVEKAFTEAEMQEHKNKVDKHIEELDKDGQNFSLKQGHAAITFGPLDYKYSMGNGRFAEHENRSIPTWLQDLSRDVEAKLGKPVGYYNHILINRYEDGSNIGRHTDAEKIYVDENNNVGSVAIYSIGETKIPHLLGGDYNGGGKNFQATSGSIVEMSTGKMYHTAPGAKGVRYSINFRHIPEINLPTQQNNEMEEGSTSYMKHFGDGPIGTPFRNKFTNNDDSSLSLLEESKSIGDSELINTENLSCKI